MCLMSPGPLGLTAQQRRGYGLEHGWIRPVHRGEPSDELSRVRPAAATLIPGAVRVGSDVVVMDPGLFQRPERARSA